MTDKKYTRVCRNPNCRKIFYTDIGNKIFCCDDCRTSKINKAKYKAKSKQYGQKHRDKYRSEEKKQIRFEKSFYQKQKIEKEKRMTEALEAAAEFTKKFKQRESLLIKETRMEQYSK